ncbi:MAG: hypothetical protein RIE73_13835 [Coleofasciculus sp. C1-SOL-03]|jgi:hypothetical protein|uniref:hypothetical protein n=1 Tax=Coleofasciculus sp. C1-SOL-03 TaxID=3069522 RepID=UPI0032F42D70
MTQIIRGLSELISVAKKIFGNLRKYEFRRRASLDKGQEVLAWVKTQNLPLDTVDDFQLPPHLVHITQRGSVQALHTADGRHCVLMKTDISWQENFIGTLYCDEPLSDSDFSHRRRAECISIEGKYDGCYDFRELYVRKRHNDCLFEVHYLLG